MRQSIRIDPAPFWANLYLYSYEEEFISNLVKGGEMTVKFELATFTPADDS